jgi:hypothetical protein
VRYLVSLNGKWGAIFSCSVAPTPWPTAVAVRQFCVASIPLSSGTRQSRTQLKHAAAQRPELGLPRFIRINLASGLVSLLFLSLRSPLKAASAREALVDAVSEKLSIGEGIADPASHVPSRYLAYPPDAFADSLLLRAGVSERKPYT